MGRGVVAGLACLLIAVSASASDIVINGKPVDAEERRVIQQLELRYGVSAEPGRYWYDPVSGLYGREGEASLGQMPPGLPLGGPLQANASAGHTGVFINGRQLNHLEVNYLAQCTPVIPGRYWMDANGNGGVEGGPLQFNLPQLCAQARRSSGSGTFGSVTGDGTTNGAIFRSPGGEVYGVTCGPDGGCIYD